MTADPRVVAAQDGNITRTPFGDRVRWITGEDATNGAYSLHERTAPPGASSPPHTHPRLHEAFYVFDGEFDFVIGDDVVRARPGTFVNAANGARHGWTVAGDRDARMLIIFTPSATRAYFADLDELARKTRPGDFDAAALAKLAHKHNLV